MWALNVAMITGPPYAIFGIKPPLGPLTGKTKCHIFGEFIDSPNIVVKFAFEKGEREVIGSFISEKEIVCKTPSFE